MVEIMIGGIDDDRARRFLGRVGDVLAQERRIDLRQFYGGDGEVGVFDLRVDLVVARLDGIRGRCAGGGGAAGGVAAALSAGLGFVFTHPARQLAADAETPAIIVRRVRMDILGPN